MPKQKYLTVEKDGAKGQVTEESLATWEKHGWTVVDDGSSEESQEPAPSAHPEPKARAPKQAEGTKE